MKAVQVILFLGLILSLSCTMQDFIFCMMSHSDVFTFASELWKRIQEKQGWADIIQYVLSNVSTIQKFISECFPLIQKEA